MPMQEREIGESVKKQRLQLPDSYFQ